MKKKVLRIREQPTRCNIRARAPSAPNMAEFSVSTECGKQGDPMSDIYCTSSLARLWPSYKEREREEEEEKARARRKEGRKEGLLGSEQYSAPPLLPIATRHHTSTLASPLQGRREGGTASWRSTFAAEVAPDSGVIYILSLENRGPCHHRSALLGRVPGSSSAAGHSPALGVS